MSSCDRCQKELSMDESVLRGEQLYCSECSLLLESDESDHARKDCEAHCLVCDQPISDGTSRLYSGKEYCANCFEKYTHMEIPLWVRLFAIGLLVLAGLGMVLNGRFYSALFSIKRANTMLLEGKIDKALAASEDALRLVPENPEIQMLGKYYRGLDLYLKGEFVKALPLLKEYLRQEPDDALVKSLVLYVEIGNSYDAGEYGLMRDQAKELWELKTDDPEVTLQYASSLACLYASRNDLAAKALAEKLIGDARAMDWGIKASDMEKYIQRIEYRIRKKVIIDSEAYENLTEEERN